MEPITHFLTGACIGRAGLNRRTRYATLAAVLAAEAGDLDMLWSVAGPVEAFQHHRGVTHTFWAAPLAAGAVVGAIWLGERLLERRRRAAFARQPVRWGWLYLTALLAALSHLLLDWTNNYGLRPFYPFNGRWYAGGIVFIAEPVLWALLLLALVGPALTGLIGGEIGARREPFRGRGWAIFALCGVVVLWGWRWSERARAFSLLEHEPITREPVRRAAMEPYPLNPFRWHGVVETAGFYQTAEIDTRRNAVVSDAQASILYKPEVTPAVEAARRTPLGQAYLDWGQWAVVRDLGPMPAPAMAPPQLAPGRQWTTVEFTDLRYDYFLTARRRPLDGWVYIVDGREEAGQAIGGRAQR